MSCGLRILHAPLNVANEDWSISRAERTLGCRSDVAIIAAAQFSNNFDIDLRYPSANPLARQVKKALAARRLVSDADVVSYSFGRSIVDYDYPGLQLLDLRFARRQGRVVAMTYHGCDARAAIPGACSWCSRKCRPHRASRRAGIIERHADIIYVKTPDLLPISPKARLLPQAVEGMNTLPHAPPSAAGPLRIVHAPSDRALKGTEHVIGAVEELRARGCSVELSLVEGVSRREALELYCKADVAVDQLLVGWYGVFAVEAMAMGKAVVCNIDDQLLEESGLKDLPIIDAKPHTLVEVLESFVVNRSLVMSAGSKGRDFATSLHDPVRIARMVLDDYARIVRSRGLAGGR